MPHITATCQYCQKPFTTYRRPAVMAKNPPKHCSMDCYLADKRRGETYICECCGSEFYARKTSARTNPKYCSRKCHTTDVGSMIDVACQTCGKVWQTQKSHQRKYCSKACSGKHATLIKKNQKYTARICKHCGKPFEGIGRLARRLFCDEHCRSAYLSGVSRDEYMAVIEATTDEMRIMAGYRGPNWKQQRYNARHRDRYCCQRCGVSEKQLGCELSVHHIKPFREFGLEGYKSANALSNLVSLCSPCHKRVEQVGWAVKQSALL